MDERNQMSRRTLPEGQAKDALEETTAPGAAPASVSVGSVEETVVRPDSLDRVRTVVDVERTTASVPAGATRSRRSALSGAI
ncbi:hypothetical protein [Nannocystis pusilla]|uniref:hypothetical protein n=1 Tax=Nannocystis pusilla TaxID=889268 RepID=UPI003B75E072